MSEIAVVVLCAAPGASTTLAYALLGPFALAAGVAFLQAVTWDATATALDFFALYLSWAVFHLQAHGLAQPRPNAARCPDYGFYGRWALPDPLGATATTYVFMWAVVWLRRRPPRVVRPLLFWLATIALYWAAAVVHGYASGAQTAFAVGEAAALALVLALVSERARHLAAAAPPPTRLSPYVQLEDLLEPPTPPPRLPPAPK